MMSLQVMMATRTGMFSAALFLFLSQTKPQENLSAQRPHASIFNMYVLLTILGQSLVHLIFLGLAVYGAKSHMEEGAELPPKDADFEPNIINTVAYTVGMLIQVRRWFLHENGMRLQLIPASGSNVLIRCFFFSSPTLKKNCK